MKESLKTAAAQPRLRHKLGKTVAVLRHSGAYRVSTVNAVDMLTSPQPGAGYEAATLSNAVGLRYRARLVKDLPIAGAQSLKT